MATATVYSHITKDPEVCGGKACVDGTRVRVLDLVCLMRQGLSPEEMLGAYPSLNLAQVYAALSYYTRTRRRSTPISSGTAKPPSASRPSARTS